MIASKHVQHLNVLLQNGMQSEYKYYRNSLITLLILGIGLGPFFWEYFTVDKSIAEPGVVPVLIVFYVGGVILLLLGMKRSKAKSEKNGEEVMLFGEVKNKKGARRNMSIYTIAAGALFVTLLKDWNVSGIPVFWLGCLFILLGILGLLGFNVFIGGPFDSRFDDDDEIVKVSEETNDSTKSE